MSDAITELLRRWNNGDRGSLDAAITAMLPQLRHIAHRIASQNGSNTFQTTALANELYVRFAKSCPGARNREHLLALASMTMQHLVVDHARGQLRQKRGGGAQRVALEETVLLSQSQLEQVVMIDEALRLLHNQNSRSALVFEMRFFGGFTVREVAEALNLSENTVIRDWSGACASLRRSIVNGQSSVQSD
jgi:RNA polymerase sigma factor (TIGR02999 family)